MPRKIVVQTADGSSPVLVETPANDEAQLQEFMKANPDLLPIEEFDMTGPLMVVGRETTLPSGAVDLVALARSGDLLVIEFKTGPQNTDFRSALAQLLDYGSDLWRMSYDDFERTVATRYFSSERCHDPRLRGMSSLERAANTTWPDLSEEEKARIRDRLTQQLSKGTFSYVLVAQRFTSTIERTIEYVNAVMPGVHFYAVELVHFSGDNLSAFESRTVVRAAQPPPSGAPSTSETELLIQIEDESYREAVRELLEACRGLGLRFEWGSIGLSVRVPTADRREPLTVAWLYPPGRAGWMGLTDLTLGYDPSSAKATPSAMSALEEYVKTIGTMPGAERAKPEWLQGHRLAPDSVISLQNKVVEALAELVRQVNETA